MFHGTSQDVALLVVIALFAGLASGWWIGMWFAIRFFRGRVRKVTGLSSYISMQELESERPFLPPYIRDPIPAAVPMICRRGTGKHSEVQGQSVPKCDGILPNRKHFDVKQIERCPKCGLAHGFMNFDGKILYGPLL